MRRAGLILLLLSFVLVACGGQADTTVPAPPGAAPFESSNNEQVNKIIAGWKTTVPKAMQEDGQVKPETIEQNVYQTSASLEEVAAFYDQLTTSNKGWVKVQGLPEIRDGQLYTGYEMGGGQTSLVVGAIDVSRSAGQGGVATATPAATAGSGARTVVYTAKGSK